MTPLEQVFMLDIESKLDYALLKKIVESGHSRVPVYELVDAPLTVSLDGTSRNTEKKTQKAKKIIGILLVKQCVLLDPKGTYLLSSFPVSPLIYLYRRDSYPQSPAQQGSLRPQEWNPPRYPR